MSLYPVVCDLTHFEHLPLMTYSERDNKKESVSASCRDGDDHGVQDEPSHSPNVTSCGLEFKFADLALPLHEVVAAKTIPHDPFCFPNVLSPVTQTTEAEDEEKSSFSCEETSEAHLHCSSYLDCSFSVQSEVAYQGDNSPGRMQYEYGSYDRGDWNKRFPGFVWESIGLPMSTECTQDTLSAQTKQIIETDVDQEHETSAEDASVYDPLHHFTRLAFLPVDKNERIRASRSPKEERVDVDNSVHAGPEDSDTDSNCEDSISSQGSTGLSNNHLDGHFVELVDLNLETISSDSEAPFGNRDYHAAASPNRPWLPPRIFRKSPLRQGNIGRSLLESARATGSLVMDAILFEDVFYLTRQVARGSQSGLWECVHKTTGKVFLAKKFSWKSSEEHISALHEVDLIRRIQEGSDLFKVTHVFQSVQTLHVVLDKIPTGNESTLQSLVLRKGRLPESTTRQIIRGILHAMKQLHGLGIGCNHLLPSHVLTTRDGSGEDSEQILSVVLVDFGVATIHERVDPGSVCNWKYQGSCDAGDSSFDDDESDSVTLMMHQFCPRHLRGVSKRISCSSYVSPETLQLLGKRPIVMTGACVDIRDEPCCTQCGISWGVADVWSVGLTMYYCLVGHLPPLLDDPDGSVFQDWQGGLHQESRSHQLHFSDSILYLREKEKNKSPANISGGSHDTSGWIKYHHDHGITRSLSQHAKQFMNACLQKDPAIRITVSEALRHPWVEMGPYHKTRTGPKQSAEENNHPSKNDRRAFLRSWSSPLPLIRRRRGEQPRLGQWQFLAQDKDNP